MNSLKNKLSTEKSPYLLQHADNPVNWYPWGNEAFERAAREDKPVFLSIGYSTCHWCHVMAHESFENTEIAALLNENFVSIKVDREERPDIDTIYMTVCRMATGRGGWPLSIFMTPDKKPFFAATYIPRESRSGVIGMKELMPRIAQLWKSDRGKIISTSEDISSALNRMTNSASAELPGTDIMDKAFNHFFSSYDKRNGGFGSAPKFPAPHNLMFLLRYWLESKNETALNMTIETLRKMRMGGIYDHIGYGFHRYSTDSEWLVPHFEKMLYDQALLSMAYLEAFQVNNDLSFRKTAEEIFEYISRDMTSPFGGFYSAEDADSGGKEGEFYIWTEEEIRNVLSPEDADLTIRLYNVKSRGNFSEEVSGELTGKNILYYDIDPESAARWLNIPGKEFGERIEKIRQTLFLERAKRIHPHKDDKVLTDWNGLMIAALAMGSRILDNNEYLKTAERAMNFIIEKMMSPDYRLLHRYREGEAAIPGNLDDYANIVWALIELYRTTFNAEYLKTAILLSDSLVMHFSDEESCALYFTPDDGEELISRPVNYYDGAVPSGNSVSVCNFLRLSRITGDYRWEETAERIMKGAMGQVGRFPAGHSMFMIGAGMLTGKTSEIVITGVREEESTRKMLAALNRKFMPHSVVVLNPSGESNPLIHDLAPCLAEYKQIDGKTTACICENRTCGKPVNDLPAFIEIIEG